MNLITQVLILIVILIILIGILVSLRKRRGGEIIKKEKENLPENLGLEETSKTEEGKEEFEIKKEESQENIEQENTTEGSQQENKEQ